jgi:hypothetical protein
MNGCLALNPSDLRAHIASPALVFDNKIDPLYYHAVFVGIPTQSTVKAVDLVAVDYTVDRTSHRPSLTSGSSSIPARTDLNAVTLFDPFHVPVSTTRSQYFRGQ